MTKMIETEENVTNDVTNDVMNVVMKEAMTRMKEIIEMFVVDALMKAKMRDDEIEAMTRVKMKEVKNDEMIEEIEEMIEMMIVMMIVVEKENHLHLHLHPPLLQDLILVIENLQNHLLLL